jgi:hypothetical protein
LYDKGGEKALDIFTTYCKPIKGLKKEAERLIPLFAEAIEIVTHMCKAQEEVQKHEPELDIESIVLQMYLGSAGGINGSTPVTKSVDPLTGIMTIENCNGKKFEIIEPAVKEWMDFLIDDKRPMTTFKTSYKRENYFVEKEADVERKSKKGRIFVIPNLVTILLEQVIGITRKLELGGAIGIGRTWSRGGMDALLKMMGVLYNHEEYELNEGDVKKLDQSLCDVLINIFFSSRLQYFDRNSPRYKYARKVVQYLIEEFTQRVTHIVGELWATVCGGVPSGALHTSHMDSWILLFLFTLFCLDQRNKHPEHAEEIMLNLLVRMMIVVYGDDNWYWIKKGPLTAILNAHVWAKWMYLHFDIEIQDIRVGHPLVSVPQGGFLSLVGGIYLRHYCVRNPVKGGGQAIYVPYRPMKEIVLKVVYGREPNVRDPVNLLLSVLGHTYGTYGSNPFTYRWLYCLYCSILQVVGKTHEHMLEGVVREEREVTRKMRQIGITNKQLMEGFPTLRYLQSLNIYDEEVHSLGQTSLRAMLAVV